MFTNYFPLEKQEGNGYFCVSFRMCELYRDKTYNALVITSITSRYRRVCSSASRYFGPADMSLYQRRHASLLCIHPVCVLHSLRKEKEKSNVSPIFFLSFIPRCSPPLWKPISIWIIVHEMRSRTLRITIIPGRPISIFISCKRWLSIYHIRFMPDNNIYIYIL